MRGARKLAALLGAEEAAAVLQGNSVVLYTLDQMAPSQPLLDETSREAWALVLDD